MIDPLISQAIACGLAGLLLYAAWHKAASHEKFRAALADYQLLPRSIVGPAAWLLAGCEAVLGLGWLAGSARPSVAAATAALMTIYALAVAVNLWRGRVHVDCGCGFGADRGTLLSWWLVMRNLVFAGLALIGGLPTTSRDLGMYDWITLVLVLAGSVLAFAAASQLASNRAVIASWNASRD
jgi:hypothetical protein